MYSWLTNFHILRIPGLIFTSNLEKHNRPCYQKLGSLFPLLFVSFIFCFQYLTRCFIIPQAVDEAIIELLLMTNIDVNDVDTEGNSALHWCLKTSKGSCSQQIKYLFLSLSFPQTNPWTL